MFFVGFLPPACCIQVLLHALDTVTVSQELSSNLTGSFAHWYSKKFCCGLINNNDIHSPRRTDSNTSTKYDGTWTACIRHGNGLASFPGLQSQDKPAALLTLACMSSLGVWLCSKFKAHMRWLPTTLYLVSQARPTCGSGSGLRDYIISTIRLHI